MNPHDADSWKALTRRQRFKYKHVEKWWFKWLYFLLCYVLKLGVLDGRSGFVFASLSDTTTDTSD